MSHQGPHVPTSQGPGNRELMDTSAESDSPMATNDDGVEQEAIVSRFATLLGTASSNQETKPLSSTQQMELLICFADSLSEDAVICTLPTLDMKVSGDNDNPMPAVGQHMETESPSDGGLHPIMEASVLSTPADASADAAKVEQKAAQRLCDTSSWRKSSIADAPGELLKNVSKSFSSLVDSRVKSWTLLMFRHSLSSGDSSSRARLLQMLAASIKVISSKSSFKTLQLPPSAAGQAKEADVILPLIFEVVLNVSLGDKSESVTLRAPGTVSGNFDSSSPKGLAKIDIRLDSGALLKSIVDQARLAVFKTVASVNSADMKPAASKPVEQAPNPSAPLTGLSGGFSSSLRLSANQATNSPRLAKARSSALKLNSVLQGTTAGKCDNNAGIRKQRSVQWDHPMELPSIKGAAATPPSSKKPRVSQTSTRMKSYKSFGRPHADDTASGPRNATFGNFGRKPIWGRDGKLANHPTPENALERSREDLMGVKVTGSVNATFGASPSASRLSSSNVANRNTNMSRLPSSLPRTATALESWLMHAAGGN